MPVSVTTKSMPNIWRTWSRETWPSVSTIAARIWAIVSTPPSCVASSTEPQVRNPKPSSTRAAKCTTTSITVVARASWATLKQNLTIGMRRSASAISEPPTIAQKACEPVVKTSATESGMSVSEKECELRRNSSSTGKRSVNSTSTAITYQGISGVWMAPEWRTKTK